MQPCLIYRLTFEDHAQNGLAPANGISKFLQILEPRRSGLCASTVTNQPRKQHKFSIATSPTDLF